MSVLKTKIVMRDVHDENLTFTLISVENTFFYALGCFISEKQSKLKKQIQNERQAVKSKYLPFIKEHLISGTMVEMNVNDNMFLNAFFDPEFCSENQIIAQSSLNDLLSEFTIKNNIAYNKLLAEDPEACIGKECKGQIALRLMSLSKLKECDEFFTANKIEKPLFSYTGLSLIKDADLAVLNTTVYSGRNVISAFNVATGKNEKQLLKGLNIVSEKLAGQQDLFVLEESFYSVREKLNLKKSETFALAATEDLDRFVCRIKDFNHLSSICEDTIMTNHAKEIFEEVRKREISAVKLKLSLSEAEKCKNKIYINVKRSEGTNFVAAFGVFQEKETDLIRVKFKRLLVGIKKTTDLLIAELPKNSEYVVYINIAGGTSFNLNVNEYGRYELDCQNSAELYKFFKEIKIFSCNEDNFNKKINKENKEKALKLSEYVFLDELNKNTRSVSVKEEKVKSVITKTEDNERVIKVYHEKKGDGISFVAKLFVKNSFIKTKYYRDYKFHEGINYIIEDLKNGSSNGNIKVELFKEQNGSFNVKEGRLYTKSKKYEWLFKRYHFFMSENPCIEELLTLEEIEKFYIGNGVKVSKKGVKIIEKINQKEEEQSKVSVKQSELTDEQKKRVKENKKLIDSYQNKKSMHNRVYFYLDGMADENTVLVSIVSKTLSKRGQTFNVCYEGSSVVSVAQMFERFIYSLKNPLKSVSKNKAVEVILHFNNSKQQYEFELLQNKINLAAMKSGYLFSVKTLNQIPNDIIYAFGETKRIEAETDRNEYMVNESDTSDDTLIIYSDASLNKKISKREFSYAFIFKENNQEVKREFIGKSYGNYTISADSSELFGIVEALKKVREMKQNGKIPADKKIEVRCDCLNAVRFLNNGLDRNKLHEKDDLKAIGEFEILKAQFVLRQKELNDLFVVKWLKGHSCESYNERVDVLAKKAFYELTELNKVIELNPENVSDDVLKKIQ